MRTFGIVVLTIILFASAVKAQVYPNKLVGDAGKAQKDSVKKAEYEYPYILPIWGERVIKKGFDLPYSAGLSVQYLSQKSDVLIHNLSFGFNNGPMYDASEIIKFNSAVATSNGVNLRPDFWLFPFLNIYGIIAVSKTSTSIDAALRVPDSTGAWNEIANISTKANFEATTTGFGLTPTVGIAGGWLALDANFTWSDVSALDKPVFTFILGPRLGKSFKLNDDEMSVAVWVGGFRVHISSETSGSVNISDLTNTEDLQQKVDQGTVKLEESQAQVDAWWNGLSAAEKQNPVNKAKYSTANRAFDAAGNVLSAMGGAIDNINSASVQYSLEKQQKEMWNFLVGTQFQIDKSWMIRAELGFLGTRSQFIGGLQYRFPF
jgi:hypothetical protein